MLSLTMIAVLPGLAGAPGKGVTVDKAQKTVAIDAERAPRKNAEPKLMDRISPAPEIGPQGYPKGLKAHETVVTFDVKPSEIHKALEGLGLKPGKPVFGDVKEQSEGPELNIYLEVPGEAGVKRVPIEKTLVDPKSGKSMPKVK